MCSSGYETLESCLLRAWASTCRMLPRNCQMLLFSATFEDSVWKFAQKVVPDPNIIKLKREEETLDTIKQYYVLCSNREEKFQALCNLYGAITIAQAMIFCHTRKTASWLAAELSKEGHQVALLSGEMMVEQRAAVIERFREGKEKVLVTTNVCARGEQRLAPFTRPGLGAQPVSNKHSCVHSLSHGGGRV